MTAGAGPGQEAPAAGPRGGAVPVPEGPRAAPAPICFRAGRRQDRTKQLPGSSLGCWPRCHPTDRAGGGLCHLWASHNGQPSRQAPTWHGRLWQPLRPLIAGWTGTRGSEPDWAPGRAGLRQARTAAWAPRRAVAGRWPSRPHLRGNRDSQGSATPNGDAQTLNRNLFLPHSQRRGRRARDASAGPLEPRKSWQRLRGCRHHCPLAWTGSCTPRWASWPRTASRSGSTAPSPEGTLRACWSRSRRDPSSSGSATATWATRCPTGCRAAAATPW